jgi:hypothetical protein
VRGFQRVTGNSSQALQNILGLDNISKPTMSGTGGDDSYMKCVLDTVPPKNIFANENGDENEKVDNESDNEPQE